MYILRALYNLCILLRYKRFKKLPSNIDKLLSIMNIGDIVVIADRPMKIVLDDKCNRCLTWAGRYQNMDIIRYIVEKTPKLKPLTWNCYTQRHLVNVFLDSEEAHPVIIDGLLTLMCFNIQKEPSLYVTSRINFTYSQIAGFDSPSFFASYIRQYYPVYEGD